MNETAECSGGEGEGCDYEPLGGGGEFRHGLHGEKSHAALESAHDDGVVEGAFGGKPGADIAAESNAKHAVGEGGVSDSGMAGEGGFIGQAEEAHEDRVCCGLNGE